MLATTETAAKTLFLQELLCCRPIYGSATAATKVKPVTAVANGKANRQRQNTLIFNYVTIVAAVAADYMVLVVACMQNLSLCMVTAFVSLVLNFLTACLSERP